MSAGKAPATRLGRQAVYGAAAAVREPGGGAAADRPLTLASSMQESREPPSLPRVSPESPLTLQYETTVCLPLPHLPAMSPESGFAPASLYMYWRKYVCLIG